MWSIRRGQYQCPQHTGVHEPFSRVRASWSATSTGGSGQAAITCSRRSGTETAWLRQIKDISATGGVYDANNTILQPCWNWQCALRYADRPTYGSVWRKLPRTNSANQNQGKSCWWELLGLSGSCRIYRNKGPRGLKGLSSWQRPWFLSKKLDVIKGGICPVTFLNFVMTHLQVYKNKFSTEIPSGNWLFQVWH